MSVPIMPIIVQKFGGSSVADSQKILAAARKAIRAQKEGNQVVVGRQRHGRQHRPADRPGQADHRSAAGTGNGHAALDRRAGERGADGDGHPFAGPQGDQHDRGADRHHDRQHAHEGPHPARSQRSGFARALDEGNIVIAAGFLGIDEDFDITTLGRGGSDTTAVALAAVLGAKSCEIYTDVDGVYTTDPRIVPEARKVSRISYDDILELATAGAGVMHNRSIEFAKNFRVPVHVRSSSSDTPGTMIAAEPELPGQAVCGAAMIKNEARVTVRGVPDRPGAAITIFAKITAKNIGMDMIVQNVADDGHADISFTVVRDDLPATLMAVEDAVKELGAKEGNCDDEVSKISIVGLGMATQPGVAERMFRALAERGINIIMITTSEIKISVLVAREYALEALRTVHSEFQLDKRRRPPRTASSRPPPPRATSPKSSPAWKKWRASLSRTSASTSRKRG